jgi:hypothetical protein
MRFLLFPTLGRTGGANARPVRRTIPKVMDDGWAVVEILATRTPGASRMSDPVVLHRLRFAFTIVYQAAEGERTLPPPPWCGFAL